MTLNESIRLARSQTAQAGEMLAKAFTADPLYAGLFPDEGERAQSLRRMFTAVASYSVVYGVVHTTPAVEGAACWLTPGNTKVTLWRLLRTGLGLQRAVAGFNPKARKAFMATLTYMDGIHERQGLGPHWYLWALGVEPGRQGKGIGSRLIQSALAQADEGGVPCYLETETERNVAFYQKHGFEVVTDGVVPDLGFRIWAMLRTAPP